MNNVMPSQRTEVIVFCSGKGGTGKTSLISALGYALCVSGHKVLFVDADRATDGLSLFVLGPEGREQLGSFEAASTFTGLLAEYEHTSAMAPAPRNVHRRQDHGLQYEVIISDRYLYGDPQAEDPSVGAAIDRQFRRPAFQRAVLALFDRIRTDGTYDYVLVDSRGGFSFESTDVAAAGDSFVVVTEATFTNFYQDRNLVDRISQAAEAMGRQAVLRGIIVNKSTDPGEASYRNELVREFGVRFEDTYPVSLDLDALRAYKQQRSVFREAPASAFAYDALQAFQRMLGVVTSKWAPDRVERWDQLVGTIETAIAARNAEIDANERAQKQEQARVAAIEAERDRLRGQLEQVREAHAQEQKRQDLLLAELRSQEAMRGERLGRDLEEARARAAQEAEIARELEVLRVRHEAELNVAHARQSARLSKLLAALLAALAAIAAVWYALAARSHDGALASAGDGASVVLPAGSAASMVEAPMSADAPHASIEGSATDAVILTAFSDKPPFLPCFKGTWNVVVSPGFRDVRTAAILRDAFAREHPDFEFQVVSTLSSRGDGSMAPAIFAGEGLTRDEAAMLLLRIRQADFISGAYIAQQTFTCAGADSQSAKQPGVVRQARSATSSASQSRKY